MIIIKRLIGTTIIIVMGFLIPRLYAQSSDLVLNNITVTATETYNATNSITAGPNFTITGSGNVTFGAPTVNLIGEFVIVSGGQFQILDKPTAIETMDDPPIPTEFIVQQNYPNPFNPSTIIQYQLPRQSFVTLKVYNALGQVMDILVNEKKNAGYHQVQFNAQHLSSGVYIYSIQAGNFKQMRKMILIR